jgi:hypothetical protein
LRILTELFDEAWGLGSFLAAVRDTLALDSLGVALRGLAAAWMVACLVLVSLRSTRVLLPSGGLLLRWSSVGCVGMWISTVSFHALRGLGAFRLPWALLGCSALLAAALFVRREVAPLQWVVRREGRAARRLFALVRRGPHALLWGVFAAFAGVLALRAFVIPPLGWDTVTYHGPRAAQWVQSGQFTFDDGVGPYNFYRHFFSGGEVLTAWAMLPFHSDLLVNFASVVQWLGVGLASWALARAIGVREPFAATSACVVMFMPTLQLEVNSGYVELPLNAALLHGLAVALACMRRPSAGAALLCAISLGVAAGIKLPGAPPAVIVAAFLVGALLITRRLGWRTKLATLGAGSVVAILPGAPWVFRAWRDTGYPLSPMPISLLGVTLGKASAAMQWYAHRPQLEPFTWAAEKVALLKVFSPVSQMNESLGSLALIPIVIFPVGLVVLARRRPFAALALALAVLAPILAHFSEGMIPVRLLRSLSSARFLVPAFALIVPVSLVWCARGSWLARSYRWLLLLYPLLYSVLALRRGWIDWEHRELVIVAVLVTQVSALALLAVRRRRSAGLAVLVVGWMLSCALLQSRRDATLPLAYEKSYALHNLPRFWAAGVAFVDDPEVPRRIAITGGPDRSSDKWFHYFFMGRRFQNRIDYIAPTVDGKTAHFDKAGNLGAPVDQAVWLGRLRAARVSEVLTFPPRSLEQGWMEASRDAFEKLAGKEDWGLFRVK